MKKKALLKRSFVFLLVAVMLGGLFVGCGDDGGSSADGEVGGKIIVGGWPSGDAAFKAAEAGFLEKYPDVEIEYQFTDTAAYFQSLQTALAAGAEAPDVAMVEGGQLGQVKNSPALENLAADPYNAEEMKDDFVSFKWNQGYSLDGERLVGIPWDIGPCSYFYRRDVFEDAGLPSEPEEVTELMSTWKGVLEVAEKIYIPGKRWFYPNATYMYTLLFMNRDYFTEDMELKMERDGDIEALQAALTMREKGWDANVVDMWAPEAYAGYADGSIASVATGAWFGGFLKTDIDPDGSGNWGVTALPAGMPASNWGGSFLALPTQSKNKATAWAYIEYMLHDADAQNTMFEAVDYYPALTTAWDDEAIYQAEDSYFGGQKTKPVWIDIANSFPTDVFVTLSDGNAEDSLYVSVNAGLEAGKSPKDIIAEAKKAVEQACAESTEQQIDAMKDAGVWKD